MSDSRRFNLDDQIRFANLSGDHNPLHIDELRARRLLFGAVVTHGIHLVLWALENWLRDDAGQIEICSIKAVFSKPIRIGDPVRVVSSPNEDGHVRFTLFSGDTVATRIDLVWRKAERTPSDSIVPDLPPVANPQDLSLDDIEGRAGSLELFLSQNHARGMFPRLTKLVPASQVSTLLATTRLVGSECPGLHSVYSELSIRLDESSTTDRLKYVVTKTDRRLGLISIGIESPGMSGTIKAFFRPSFQQQDRYLNLRRLVSQGEFNGQRALIIGGSRGLGEVVAKLLSAGGADVTMTYARGEDDAKRVADEIATEGRVAGCHHLDVLNAASRETLSSRLGDSHPTHLYYFATPFIVPGNSGVFSEELFSRFCSYYVFGLIDTVNALKRLDIAHVFNPSSVMVADVPKNMGEYATAKSASETIGAFIANTHKNMVVYQPRLPRMSTDQTVSLTPLASENPVNEMLRHLRVFREMKPPGGRA